MPKAKAGTGEKPGIVPRERYGSGDLKPAEERGKAPALVKRIMDHAVALGADARCATVLGRLHLEGVITETEFAAGTLYAEDVGAWERIKGHPRRSARSPSFDSGYGRADVDLEALERMDPEAADKLKRRLERKNKRVKTRYEKAQVCIPDRPILLSTILEQVCCNDMPVHSVHYPSLKAMLGNLARECYRLNNADATAPSRKPKKPVTKADVKDLADAAVEALAEWFRKRQAQVAFFRVQHRAPWQPAGLAAFGMTHSGEPIQHGVKLRGEKGIDEALVAAARAKGWSPMRAERIETIDMAELKAAVAKLKGDAA